MDDWGTSRVEAQQQRAKDIHRLTAALNLAIYDAVKAGLEVSLDVSDVGTHQSLQRIEAKVSLLMG